ncbi:MAG: di-trans,poly-cis-decaprenylcistransferase [Gammaproteobacteria bacterium]|nr:di-trans,poly-cis-decaprenylcistransferase [Gammaproteobacteria bacterium]
MTLPRHVAIIMDGNGRWAAARGLPRHAGHRQGVAPVRTSVEECVRRGVEALTLFAFSSENWRRPEPEVSGLMGLFVDALDRDLDELHARGVRLRFIGDRRSLAVRLQARMAGAEARTAANDGLKLQVAVGYGGRWDIVEAAKRLARACASGALRPEELTEERFAASLELAGLPDPDLFVRTGGERRISNFLLWNLAYTELWFSDCLWPDFDASELTRAFEFFASRQRRFGLTTPQTGETRDHA